MLTRTSRECRLHNKLQNQIVFPHTIALSTAELLVSSKPIRKPSLYLEVFRLRIEPPPGQLALQKQGKPR